MRTTILAILFLFSAVLSSATADVFENDAYLLGNSPSYNLGLSSINDIADGLFLFRVEELSEQTIDFSFLGIAELIAVYEVQPDVVFDINFVDNNNPLSINDNTFNNGIVELEIGQSVFIGYADDRNFSYEFDSTDYFGWAEIARTANGLELVGSATATSNGIIVGTTIQIPEPTCATLIGLLTILVGSRRRR